MCRLFEQCCAVYCTAVVRIITTILQPFQFCHRPRASNFTQRIQSTFIALLLCLQRGVLRGFESTKVAVNFAPVAQQVYNARAALLLLPPDEVKANASTAAAAALSTVVEAPADASNISNMTTAGLQESGQPNDAGLTAAELSLPVQQQEEADSRDSEKLILTVVGEATQGALRVEPSNVSFGVVNVGYPQHRTLTLINQSSGVLRYSVELVVDSTETIERDTAACEFAAPTAALLAGARGDDAGGGRGCLEDCWVDEADGVVNARWVTQHPAAPARLMLNDNYL